VSTEQFAFGSAPWFDRVKACLHELVATHGEVGRRFTLCEVFTDAPRSVAVSGVLTLHYMIDGKSAVVGRGELPSPDLRVQSDYAAAVPAARRILTPEMMKPREGPPPARSRGPVVEGDLNLLPPYFVDLHNRMAAVTAPLEDSHD
jgi:hypothetical protein